MVPCEVRWSKRGRIRDSGLCKPCKHHLCHEEQDYASILLQDVTDSLMTQIHAMLNKKCGGRRCQELTK
jgi:hypothetical protein